MEDDLLLEEQIKKKKRAVLLLLLILLVLTAGATMLLEPAPLPSTAVARVETPTSTEPATSIATSTPAEFQGDEWTQPTPPVPEDNRTTPLAVTPTVTTPASPRAIAATRQTSTPTATQVVTQGGTTVAEIPVTTDSGTFITTPAIESSVQVEGSDTTASTGEAVPAATEISKRINESWDVLDKYESISGNEVNVTETVAVSQPLTGTATLSETVAALPPDGLPVTGIITPRRMNWAALALVVVLIGTGTIGLLYPKSLDT